jgi:hypothetical protein
MGKLTYDRTVAVDFDDRTLTHLQVVIGLKLRRNESFYFSWKDDQRVGDGRTAIWLHPMVSLMFKFYGSRSAAINPAWIHMMELAANTSAGLKVIPEPEISGSAS